VATSAEEGRQMKYLTDSDRIIVNQDYLLMEAKRTLLEMVREGYRPPAPAKLYAAGRDAYAALQLALYQMEGGGYASAHDVKIGKKIGNVLTGGELSAPTWVDESYLLDLEREAFVALCREPKTIERIWHMLNTNKPLRN
jgi:3-hydroxyacyl-CoA dehydrogenase